MITFAGPAVTCKNWAIKQNQRVKLSYCCVRELQQLAMNTYDAFYPHMYQVLYTPKSMYW